jgi:hypothetical protein
MDYEPLASASGDRASLLSYLAHASVYGNLGLFIGSGFSKAVVNEPPIESALSWRPLLEKAAEDLGLDAQGLLRSGMSFPSWASTIVRALSGKMKISLEEATAKFKGQIAQITSWYAAPKHRDRFGPPLQTILPSWVITTNYDLVFESLLPGLCVALGPDQVPSVRKGRIASYHLHGVRTDPSSLVVTEEDYVRLFRPADYRQTKLATLLKESVTLVLGYGLGDVNVLTALDWASNVYGEAKGSYPRGVVQLVRDPNLHEPQIEGGLVVIGGAEIVDFLDELAVAVRNEKEKIAAWNARLERITALLGQDDVVGVFLDEPNKRATVLRAFKSAEDELLVSFLAFLKRVIDVANTRSEPSGAFEAYAQHLDFLIDLLKVADAGRSPALFHALADALSRLSLYVGERMGQSWKASELWKRRKAEIPASVIADLKDTRPTISPTSISRGS